MTRRPKVVVAAEFRSGGLPGANSLLGTTWPISELGTLHFPQGPAKPWPVEGNDLSWRNLRAPEVVASAPRLIDWWEARKQPAFDSWWGSVYHWNPTQRQVFAAWVAHVVVELDLDRVTGTTDDGLVADSLRKVESWLTTCADWAEALFGLDTAEDASSRSAGEQHRVENFVFEFDDGSAKRVEGIDRQQPWILEAAGHPISKADWGQVVERVNRGESVPLGHMLLRDAHRSCTRNSLRRSILDAGSACEVALATSIRSFLESAGADSDRVDRLLGSQISGIVALYRLHEAVVAPIDGTTTGEVLAIATARNKAAHAGEPPKPEPLRMLLAAADHLVKTVRPL